MLRKDKEKIDALEKRIEGVEAKQDRILRAAAAIIEALEALEKESVFQHRFALRVAFRSGIPLDIVKDDLAELVYQESDDKPNNVNLN